MATGIAIHIGLNGVDPDKYDGWDGALAACENDATEMEKLTATLNYKTQLLLTANATADAVFTAIKDAAYELSQGDICVITYAGHGGQFRDLDGEESDSLDETWLLYDREVLDDEIHDWLGNFGEGVRVVVLSDSCHSGSVVRDWYENVIIEGSPEATRAYKRVAPDLRSRRKVRAKDLVLRGVPQVVQDRVLEKYRALYSGIRAKTPTREQVELNASIILISGCQDNQQSAENDGHGVFTAAVLKKWEEDDYFAGVGDYPGLHTAVVADLPPSQAPNYMTDGVAWPEFEKQIPFTIDAAGAGYEEPEESTEEEPEEPIEEEEEEWPTHEAAPSVTGPTEPVSRADSAPYFRVDSGSNPYYIFEIAADAVLFDADRADERSGSTWYSSWDDPDAPVRLEGELYWLPEPAWEDLRGSDRLWFRIGTTPAADSWDGYVVSTADDDGENAPSFGIVSSDRRRAARSRGRRGEVEAILKTAHEIFSGSSDVPISVDNRNLGMAYAIPRGTASTVVDSYSPWTPYELRQRFYEESSVFGSVLADITLIMSWRCSQAGQYIIDANLDKQVTALDPTTDVSITVRFNQPSLYDVEWEAYEIPFTVELLYDPVGGSSTTLYRGYIRANGDGRFSQV